MDDDRELDKLILSLAKPRWQKTAMVIAKTLEQREGGLSDPPAEQVARRIQQLVETNRLESQGNLTRWRFSEIRLPAAPGAKHDKNLSPVGWYVASYILRFVELDREDKDDLDGRFFTYENTIIVKAGSLDEAYDKTVTVAKGHTEPYKGGSEGVDVQWVFEGLTEILPIYEELEDGAEIMWAKHGPRKLRNIRRQALHKGEIHK